LRQTCGSNGKNGVSPLYQHESMDSEEGKRVTHNVSARVPGFGVQNFCFSTDKKNIEKDKTKKA